MTFTNQVPATWFAGDAGIRRLALQSDGPVHRGRRRFCTNVSGCSDRSSLSARRSSRSALRKPCSASPTAATDVLAPGRHGQRTGLASCWRYRSTCSAMTVRVAASGSFIALSLARTSRQIETPWSRTLSISWPHCALGDRTRRPASSRGLPLAAGRRARPAQHQRVARAAAGRVARCVRRRAVAGRVAPLPRPRRHRAARGDRRAARRRVPSRCSPPTARTRCCRRCCSPTAAPGRTVATFEPTYQLHGHIARLTGADGRRGRARRRLHASTSTRSRRVARASTDRRSRSCARPTTRPGWSSRPATCASRARPRRPGSSVVDEAYGQFAAVVGARRWSTSDRPLVVTRTFSKTWSMARPGSATSSARRGWSPSSRRSCCRTTSTPPSRSPAGWRCDFADEMEARVARDRRRARAARRRARPTLPVDVWPVGRQLHPVPPARRRRPRRCGRACSTAACWSATARAGRASTAACASRSAPPTRTTRSSPRSTEVARDEPRRARRSRDHEGDRRSTSPSTSTAPGVTDVSHRHPVLRPHARPARPPRRLRPHRRGHRRPRTSTPTTPSRTSASLLGEAFREALGDKAGVRRFASGLFPLDEALVEVALDLSGRPFVVWDVTLPRVPAARQPAVRPAAGRARRGVVRHRRRHHAARHAAARAQRPPHHRGTFKGLARCLRDAVRVEGARRAVDEGRAVSRRASAADRRARLRHRQPALGAEGAAARRRRRPPHRRPRPDRRRRRGGAARRRRVRRVHGALRGAASRTSRSTRVDVGPAVPRHLRRHADAVRRLARRRPARRPRRPPRHGPLAPGRREAPADAVEPCSTLDAARRPAVRRPRRAEPWVYFVHSLHGVPDDPAVVVATCDYGGAGQRRVPARQRVRHAVPPGEVRRGRPGAARQLRPRRGRRRRRADDRAVPGDRPARRQVRAPAPGRLRAARPSTATTRSPWRRSFADAGAPWIHVVDLDAARSGCRRTGRSWRRSPRRSPGGRRCRPVAACARSTTPRQLADAGVARVVMGSAAIATARARRRRRRDRRRWPSASTTATARSPCTAGPRRAACRSTTRSARFPAASAFVITDIARDGMLDGPDVDGLPRPPPRTAVPGDRQRRRRHRSTTSRALAARSPGIAGIITGKALYEGRFTRRRGAVEVLRR